MRTFWAFSDEPLSLQDRRDLERLRQHNDGVALRNLIKRRARPEATDSELDELRECDSQWAAAWEAFGHALRAIQMLKKVRVRRASERPSFEV